MVAPVVVAAARVGTTAGARTAAVGTARTETVVPRATIPAVPRREQSFREVESPQRGRPTYQEQERQRKADKKVVHIDNLMAIAMLLIALVFDAIQFFLSFLHVVPVVGNALALVVTGYIGVVASWMIFPIWFKVLHVEFLKGNQAGLKVAALGVPAVAEFVTFINALPFIVAGVGVNIAISRFEDVFGDFSELEKTLRDTSPGERAKMQRDMASAFVAGRRYRAPGKPVPRKPANDNAPRPSASFDIPKNQGVYDYGAVEHAA